MNEQMTRLYSAAKSLRGIDGKSTLARALETSPQTINNWEERGISKQGMIQAQRVFGCSAEWLETGAGNMSFEVRTITGQATQKGLAVPLLANAASMGAGEELAEHDVVAGALTLTPQFVADQLHPSRPEALRFIHAYGDSMEPTFFSGDILLVDTGVRDVKIDGVFVLSAYGRLFVKRVRQRLDGHFEVSSDNPTHKTVDVLNGDQGVSVIGRVLWVWNGHKM